MTALSSNFFLPFERQEVARRESIKGEGGRKEIREKGKRCTAIKRGRKAGRLSVVQMNIQRRKEKQD